MSPGHEESRPRQESGSVSSTTQHGTRPGDTALGIQPMPPLSPEQYDALKADIMKNGIRVPVVVDQHGRVLDGHNRRRIADELGIHVPVEIITIASDEAAYDTALSLNCARRHLTREQVRALIGTEISRRPGDSDRAIARRIGCDHKTVGSVRGGELPHLQVSNLDTPAMSRDEAEQLTAKIKDSLTAAVTALDSLIYEALSNAIPALEILAALTRRRRDFERNCQPGHNAEAGLAIAEVVFNPRFDYLLDPGTVDEWRPQWDHPTFLPYTDDEMTSLLNAIGGVR